MSSDEISESSNLENDSKFSPYSHSSPSQLVPQLANGITELTWDDAVKNNKPYLRIVEQPLDYFRFRYKSEMIGTHGSLLGKYSSPSKQKTYPTVELCNYNGKAAIQCKLVQHNNEGDHPHKITENDQDRDIIRDVPTNGKYKATFSGMGIIHTAKKDIFKFLFEKYTENRQLSEFEEKRIRMRCETESKAINLNIVRLRFSAHDITTGELLCPSVYSDPVHNMKSAATNDLKICRMSRWKGSPNGGDEVFIFVEKVNKKNIMIRFFEEDEDGNRVWESNGDFVQTDVHHQYAIVFRTPAYRSRNITRDVKVYFELFRPSDGRTSEPREFIYKADLFSVQVKKRKAGSSLSSIGSSGSVKSFSELPLTVDFTHQENTKEMDVDKIPQLPLANSYVPPTPPSNYMLAEALFNDVSSQPGSVFTSPMLSQPNVPAPPVIHIDSGEIKRLLEPNPHIPSEEKQRFLDSNFSEYFRSFEESLQSDSMMSFVKNSLFVADSGKPKVQYRETENQKLRDSNNSHENIRIKTEYSEVYSAEDGKEVKTIVKELCDLIRTKVSGKRAIIQDKLRRLFEMRLSNGDTFLHMTLCTNQPSSNFIVKLIHDVQMCHLLNLQNERMRTILHLAVIYNQEDVVPFLLANGCDPMVEDSEGNNAIHYAVICQSCLAPLLSAIKQHNIPHDINAYNNEKQTALHLAVIHDSEKCSSLLLQSGASCSARDLEGRTPLHLAATRDCLPVAACLMDYIPISEVDTEDGRGYSALELLCAEPMRDHTLDIAKLLLDNKADPARPEAISPAWSLARDKPALLELLRQYGSVPDHVKAEPDDLDYDSAEDEEIHDEASQSPAPVLEDLGETEAASIRSKCKDL